MKEQDKKTLQKKKDKENTSKQTQKQESKSKSNLTQKQTSKKKSASKSKQTSKQKLTIAKTSKSLKLQKQKSVIKNLKENIKGITEENVKGAIKQETSEGDTNENIKQQEPRIVDTSANSGTSKTEPRVLGVVLKKPWSPKTKLGKDVKEGKIKNLKEVFDSGKKIIEPQIIDYLLPDAEIIFSSVGQSKGKFGGGKRSIWKQTQKKTS